MLEDAGASSSFASVFNIDTKVRQSSSATVAAVRQHWSPAASQVFDDAALHADSSLPAFCRSMVAVLCTTAAAALLWILTALCMDAQCICAHMLTRMRLGVNLPCLHDISSCSSSVCDCYVTPLV